MWNAVLPNLQQEQQMGKDLRAAWLPILLSRDSGLDLLVLV